jgi:hypothetical protein
MGHCYRRFDCNSGPHHYAGIDYSTSHRFSCNHSVNYNQPMVERCRDHWIVTKYTDQTLVKNKDLEHRFNFSASHMSQITFTCSIKLCLP